MAEKWRISGLFARLVSSEKPCGKLGFLVQFRKWANGIVKDYTIKGWVMDDERLKNGGSVLTVEYFDHLLEQI